MKREYANYHVALKFLLKRKDEVLFLKSNDGTLDLPGGRIDEVEHNTPLLKILGREIKEELGAKIKYKIGKIISQYRRHFKNRGWHVFLTVYEGDYFSGDIKISDEHDSFVWLNPKNYKFKKSDFFNGLEEYRVFKKYFNQ